MKQYLGVRDMLPKNKKTKKKTLPFLSAVTHIPTPNTCICWDIIDSNAKNNSVQEKDTLKG